MEDLRSELRLKPVMFTCLPRSIIYDLNLTTPLMSGVLEDGEVGGSGLALALPPLYFMCILPVYCCVILLASLGHICYRYRKFKRMTTSIYQGAASSSSRC